MKNPSIKTVLVTGGAGYIGSHTCLELLNKNYELIVIDNLSNSNIASIETIQDISKKNLKFIEGDLRDKRELKYLFASNDIDAVIHFAGLKAVGESFSVPINYYENNLLGTINLLSEMKVNNVKNIVFSSSATVYGEPERLPITEDFPLLAKSPYGRSKLYLEEILRDVFVADSGWNVSILRYFNPVGAHESGLIGEDINVDPKNLMPSISQVALGKREQVLIYGSDYATKDGTGVRDYIHVVDLAIGHIKALEKFSENPGYMVHNLGTGHGYSVFDLIKAFEKTSKTYIPFKIVERRNGDVSECYADTSKALEDLNWKAEKGLDEMCKDTWTWLENNR